MAHIEIRNLEKSFGETPVLRGIDLSIAQGEFLAILGPSGCGKSTLLRIVAGLEAHDRGAVLMGGQVVDGLAPKTRDVAVVFQSYALYPHMTVAQNLALPLVMRDLTRVGRLPFARHLSKQVKRTRADIRQAVERAAAQVEIGSLLERKPGQLSGGQRQRVALARALIRKPKLFLLDEPLSNLDATLRASTRAEIVQLQKQLGTTAIYVTHDQTEAMTMADRIAIMIDGEIVQVGTAREIYHRPSDVRAARFIGTPKMNLFDGIVENGAVRLAAGGMVVAQVAGSPNGPVQIGLRPEHIALAPRSGDGAVPVTVTHREFLGSEALAHLTVAGGASGAIARLEPHAVDGLETGQPAFARFHTDHVHVFTVEGARIERAAERPTAASGRPGSEEETVSDGFRVHIAGA